MQVNYNVLIDFKDAQVSPEDFNESHAKANRLFKDYADAGLKINKFDLVKLNINKTNLYYFVNQICYSENEIFVHLVLEDKK